MARPSAAQLSAPRLSPAQLSPAQLSSARLSPAQLSSARPSSARISSARIKAQPGRARRMGRLIRRVLSLPKKWTAIYLRCTLPHTSSGLPGNWASSRERSLSDLAPGEVYKAGPITRAPGGLLHRRFTLTPENALLRVRWRSTLCCTVSRIAPGGGYPPPCSVEPGRSSSSALPLRDPRMTRPSCRPIRCHAAYR